MTTTRPHADGATTTFVLVHGAWHDAWCWDRLAEHVRRAGHTVEAVSLPGRESAAAAASARLDDYVETILECIDACDGPVVLVGHSLGGMSVTCAADARPEKVDHLVYVAAWVPLDGTSVFDLAQAPEFADSLAGRYSVFDFDEGVGRLPREHAPEVLYGHLPPSVATECSSRLVPEGVGVQMEQVSLTGAAARVTTTYIETTDDRAIPPAAQRKMAREAGCGTVLSIESDHSPMLSHVEELASLLLTLGQRRNPDPPRQMTPADDPARAGQHR